MDRSKRLAVLDSSENIRMVFDYRAIVIPAALLSRNPADFRRLAYSFSQRFKLATDTFKGPDETQEPGFRPKHCRNDDLTPGNVKLCESAGRAGGLPCYFRDLGIEGFCEFTLTLEGLLTPHCEFTLTLEGLLPASCFLLPLFAASGCRFYCRFWLPLLVDVLQGQICP